MSTDPQRLETLGRLVEDSPAIVFLWRIEPVRRLFEELPDVCRERVAFTSEVESLAREYVARGVVPEAWLEDCRHVAAATVARADAIVSWNFRHIVKLDKIKGYNQVNLLNGYGVLTIVSPKEVSFDE
jgi:hypothetical protein